jgi:hypothetical protein
MVETTRNWNTKMHGKVLNETACEHDLGAMFTSDLKWKQQISACESKADAMLGMLKHTFASIDTSLLKTM